MGVVLGLVLGVVLDILATVRGLLLETVAQFQTYVNSDHQGNRLLSLPIFRPNQFPICQAKMAKSMPIFRLEGGNADFQTRIVQFYTHF